MLNQTKTLEDAYADLRTQYDALEAYTAGLQDANTRQARTILELAGKAEQYRHRATMLRQQARRWRDLHRDVLAEYVAQARRFGLLRTVLDEHIHRIPAPYRLELRKWLARFDRDVAGRGQ